MPISRYDALFGGNAAKALASMIRTYGEKKGREVFYATANSKKQGGLHHALKRERRRQKRKKGKRKTG